MILKGIAVCKYKTISIAFTNPMTECIHLYRVFTHFDFGSINRFGDVSLYVCSLYF